jgi:hypothetical protein
MPGIIGGHCPYYNAAKDACRIKDADNNGTGGKPSNILADCRKDGKEARICAYQRRFLLLSDQES